MLTKTTNSATQKCATPPNQPHEIVLCVFCGLLTLNSKPCQQTVEILDLDWLRSQPQCPTCNALVPTSEVSGTSSRRGYVPQAGSLCSHKRGKTPFANSSTPKRGVGSPAQLSPIQSKQESGPTTKSRI